MEYIELLGCDEKTHRIKILQIILNYTKIDLKEATKLVENLFLNNSVTLKLDLDIEKCNILTKTLSELGIRIGNISWHEENRK